LAVFGELGADDGDGFGVGNAPHGVSHGVSGVLPEAVGEGGFSCVEERLHFRQPDVCGGAEGRVSDLRGDVSDSV